MSENDFGLIDVCCISESDGQSIRDTLERLRKSYTEESGLIHLKDFARAAFEFPWINPQRKIYAMMIVVQAVEYQQYRNELEEKVKQAVKDGIQMGASHERLTQSQNEQQAVEKAMDEYRKAMEFVIAKDKTPQYPYGFVEESRDNHGKFPLSGKWNTPKEYAEIAIKEIDARWPKLSLSKSDDAKVKE